MIELIYVILYQGNLNITKHLHLCLLSLSAMIFTPLIPTTQDQAYSLSYKTIQYRQLEAIKKE